jgi:hypothetical protein
MKKIVLLLLFISLSLTSAFGLSKDHINEITYKYGEETYGDPRAPKHKDTVNMVEFESWHRYRFNDIVNITGEMAFYSYPSVYDPAFNRYTDKESIVALNELLLNINLTDHLTLSLGQIPAHDGAYSSLKTNNMVKSDLLYTVVDNGGQGAFLAYDNNVGDLHYKAKVGKVEAKYYPFNNEIKYNDRLEGTNGIYAVGVLEYERAQLIYNHIDLEVRVDGSYYLDGTVDALGFKYDDSDRTGLIGYGIVSQSDTDGMDSYTIMHPVYHIPVSIPFNLDGKGQSKLFGLKYMFDVVGYESFVGYEYYTADRKNMSFNNGNPNSEYGLGVLGHADTYYIGVNITPTITAQLQYKETEYEFMRSTAGTRAYAEPRVDKETMLTIKYLF